jgi:hypothetical protein
MYFSSRLSADVPAVVVSWVPMPIVTTVCAPAGLQEPMLPRRTEIVEPGGAAGDLRARLLLVLDRKDIVAARSRLERRYGTRPLPISQD